MVRLAAARRRPRRRTRLPPHEVRASRAARTPGRNAPQASRPPRPAVRTSRPDAFPARLRTRHSADRRRRLAHRPRAWRPPRPVAPQSAMALTSLRTPARPRACPCGRRSHAGAGGCSRHAPGSGPADRASTSASRSSARYCSSPHCRSRDSKARTPTLHGHHALTGAERAGPARAAPPSRIGAG